MHVFVLRCVSYVGLNFFMCKFLLQKYVQFISLQFNTAICSHKPQWCLGFHLLFFSLFINEKSLGLIGALLVIFTNSFKKFDVPVSNF